MTRETYYGQEDIREATKDSYQQVHLRAERRVSQHGSACLLRALSGRHVLLIGSTGSGKTYAAAKMTKFLDAFLFVNTQEEKEVSDVCQVRLDDPSEVQDAMNEGHRAMEFVPSMDREEARKELEILRAGVFAIGSEMKTQANVLELPFWITVFIDEMQLYTPLHTHLDAENFFTRGRGYGIKSVALSRQPQELSKEVVNNCEFELIFQLGHYALPYFKTFKIPIESHQEWINKKHHFLLYDKTSIIECYPV